MQPEKQDRTRRVRTAHQPPVAEDMRCAMRTLQQPENQKQPESPLRWRSYNHLPAGAPCPNAATWQRADLFGGASEDGRYLYDALCRPDGRLLLTLIAVDQEWGFIECERHLEFAEPAAMLAQAAGFEAAPRQVLDELAAETAA